jgi:anti-sigma28 factor (negative regulator of flagellin synthesis)
MTASRKLPEHEAKLERIKEKLQQGRYEVDIPRLADALTHAMSLSQIERLQ